MNHPTKPYNYGGLSVTWSIKLIITYIESSKWSLVLKQTFGLVFSHDFSGEGDLRWHSKLGGDFNLVVWFQSPNLMQKIMCIMSISQSVHQTKDTPQS